MKRTFAILATLFSLALVAAPAFAQQEGVNGAGGIFLQQKVGADFTDGNGVTTAQNIPALQFNIPSVAATTFQLSCEIGYSQATNVADTLAVQFSVAPAAENIGGIAATNATAYGSGTPNATADTASHTVVAFTPAVTSVLYAHIGGSFELAANTPTTLNIQVAQSTAADVIVIKRDSVCSVWSTPSK